MIIVGVDEAGRGALVGNVVAGATVLNQQVDFSQFTDSKKLSASKRGALFDLITEKCPWAVGEASSTEIDQINILQATMLAMRRAVNNLNISYDQVLVDGDKCPKLANCRSIVKGDLSQPVISAASIIAKVYRDKQMFILDKRYPQYGFAVHKGYPTKAHLAALTRFGAIKGLHRYSYAPVKKLV